MFQRPTSLAAAFINAAVKTPCNPEKGTGNWIARRSIINADRVGFGVVKEFDHSPHREPRNDHFEHVALTDEEVQGVD